MPRHTFQCNDCNHEYNINLKITEEIKANCDKCGSDNTEKIFHSAIDFIPCRGMYSYEN